MNLKLVPYILLFAVSLYFQPLLYAQQSQDLESMLQAAESYEKAGNLAQAAFHHNQIAFIYWDSNELSKSIEHFEKSKQLNEQINNQAAIGKINNYIGLLYSDMQQASKSIAYFKEGVRIMRQLGTRKDLAPLLVNLAIAEANIASYNNANVSLNEAIDIAKEESDIQMLHSCYGMMAQNYSSLNNSVKSSEYYDMFLAIDKKLKDDQMASVVANQQATQRAFNDQTSVLSATSDSLEKAEQMNKDRMMRIELLEQEKRLLEKDKELQALTLSEQKARLSKQRAVRNALIMIIIITLLFFVLLYRQYKQKQSANQLLAIQNSEIKAQKTEIEYQRDLAIEQKAEIERQKNELTLTLKRLRETQGQLVEAEKMASLGGLVAGVAHEINTPVGIGITATSTIVDDTKQIAEEFKLDTMTRASLKKYLQSTYETSKLVLNNLLRTGELIQSFKQVSVDQSAEQKRSFILKSYLQDILRSLHHKLKYNQIEIEVECPETLQMNSYPGYIAQIITNLVINSQIHGFKNRENRMIRIQAEQDQDNLVLLYSDNGNGIASEILPKIFDPFFTTDRQSGTGLGMHITYNLVTQLGGQIHCSSKQGEGVIFTVTIPIKTEG